MKEKNKMFFVDAETDGLYGMVISVAIIVTDMKGNEIERAYYGVDVDEKDIEEAWVIENVLPIRGDYTVCEDEEELLEKLWEMWEKYREEAYAIGDVIYPVECRVFEKCVRNNIKERKFNAPFPFMDLSNHIYMNGYDPLTPRTEILKEEQNGMQHNALYDTEVSVKIWRKFYF